MMSLLRQKDEEEKKKKEKRGGEDEEKARLGSDGSIVMTIIPMPMAYPNFLTSRIF